MARVRARRAERAALTSWDPMLTQLRDDLRYSLRVAARRPADALGNDADPAARHRRRSLAARSASKSSRPVAGDSRRVSSRLADIQTEGDNGFDGNR